MANLSDYIVKFNSVDTLASVIARGSTTSSNITVGNLTSTGIDDNATSTALTVTDSGIAATLTTASQPNITSVGTLSGFSSTGIDDNATSTAITIDASENVGIGGSADPFSRFYGRMLGVSSASSSFLEINAATGNTSGIDFGVNSARTAGITSNTTETNISTLGSTPLNFATNTSTRMTIDSSGRVGIGMTANSGCLLNVNNHIRAENSAFLAGRETAALPAFAFHDDTDTGMFNVATNILAFSTGGSERMRIDSSGNVGIGTTSPSNYTNYSTLTLQDATGGEIDFINGSSQVVGAIYNTASTLTIASDFTSAIASSAISFTIDGSERLRLQNDGSLDLVGDFYVGPSNNIIYESGTTFNVRAAVANLTFQTNGANERMRIDSAGRVSIGTTSATELLNIAAGANNGAGVEFAGDGATVGAASFFVGQGSGKEAYLYNRHNARMIFAVNSTERMRLETNGDLHVDGDVIAYSTTISDQRLKDNVETINGALNMVTNLRGVTYTWNAGSRAGKSDLGVIAQEVEAVIPEIVHEKEMALVDGETYKTVDYEKLTAVLIEAVKELKAEVDNLKASQ